MRDVRMYHFLNVMKCLHHACANLRVRFLYDGSRSSKHVDASKISRAVWSEHYRMATFETRGEFQPIFLVDSCTPTLNWSSFWWSSGLSLRFHSKWVRIRSESCVWNYYMYRGRVFCLGHAVIAGQRPPPSFSKRAQQGVALSTCGCVFERKQSYFLQN